MLLSERSHARERRWRTSRLLLLTALVALYAYAYRWTTFVPDTARDVVQALALLRDGVAPADGPLIAERWVLGPTWFYVVASFCAVARSTATLALLVGLLAATKIPLAWSVGRRAHGTAAGVAFALLVALPGWTLLEHLVWSHTNLVQATALLALALLLRWRERPGDARAFFALAALGLALQAHPTNLVAAMPFLAMLAPRTLRASLRGIVAGGLALLAIALPSGLHELGAPVAAAAAGASPFPPVAAGLAGLPELLVQVVLRPHQPIAFMLGQRLPVLDVVVQAGSGLLVGIGLAGIALELVAGRRRVAVLLVAWTFASVLLVALLRPWTPAYMAYAPQLAASAMLAFGLAAACARVSRRAAAAAGALAGAFVLAVAGAWIADRVAAQRDGMQRIPRMALIDVRKAVEPLDPPNVMFTALDHARLARAVCRGELARPVAGDLAAMLLMGQGAPLRLAGCAPARWPVLGGGVGASAGLPRELARRAGIAVDATLASFALAAVVRSVHAAPDSRMSYVTAYPPYDYFGLAPRRQRWTVPLAAGERLLVSDLLVFFDPWAASATVAGVPLAPIARSENTSAWACPSGTDGCVVELEVEARTHRWIQAYVVRAR